MLFEMFLLPISIPGIQYQKAKSSIITRIKSHIMNHFIALNISELNKLLQSLINNSRASPYSVVNNWIQKRMFMHSSTGGHIKPPETGLRGSVYKIRSRTLSSLIYHVLSKLQAPARSSRTKVPSPSTCLWALMGHMKPYLDSSDLLFPEPLQWRDQHVVCVLDLRRWRRQQ